MVILLIIAITFETVCIRSFWIAVRLFFLTNASQMSRTRVRVLISILTIVLIYLTLQYSSNDPNTDASKVSVELYVMSQCPDAEECERVFHSVMSEVNDIAVIRNDYIGVLDPNAKYGVACKHGDQECLGKEGCEEKESAKTRARELCMAHLNIYILATSFLFTNSFVVVFFFSKVISTSSALKQIISPPNRPSLSIG